MYKVEMFPFLGPVTLRGRQLRCRRQVVWMLSEHSWKKCHFFVKKDVSLIWGNAPCVPFWFSEPELPAFLKQDSCPHTAIPNTAPQSREETKLSQWVPFYRPGFPRCEMKATIQPWNRLGLLVLKLFHSFLLTPLMGCLPENLVNKPYLGIDPFPVRRFKYTEHPEMNSA